MDLNVAYSQIKAVFERENIEYKCERDSDKISFVPKIEIKSLGSKGKVYCSVNFYNNGVGFVHFLFGELEKNERNLKLLNVANGDKSYSFKAYITVDEGQLNVQFSYILCHEEDVGDYVDFAFATMASEKAMKLLAPLILSTV